MMINVVQPWGRSLASPNWQTVLDRTVNVGQQTDQLRRMVQDSFQPGSVPAGLAMTAPEALAGPVKPQAGAPGPTSWGLPSLQAVLDKVVEYGRGTEDLARQVMGSTAMPGPEVFQRQALLQQRHDATEKEWVEARRKGLALRKDALFAEHRYRTDDQGRLVLDGCGLPILEKGPETPRLRLAREIWENERALAAHEAEPRERERLLGDKNRRLEALTGDARRLATPEGQEEYRRLHEEIARAEEDLEIEQRTREMLLPVEHLPDPQSPGRTLGDYVTATRDGYRQMRQIHRTAREQTADGKALAELQRRTQELVRAQREQLRKIQEAEFDPDAMRRLAREMGIAV